MRKFIFFAVILVLLSACNILESKTKNSQGRYSLHMTNSEVPNVYVIDAQNGHVWMLIYQGVTDERTGLYPIIYRDSAGRPWAGSQSLD